MVTDDDIQGFRFMGEPHESDHTVIELKYATGAAACVAVPNEMLSTLVQVLRDASDAAEAAQAGVAVGVMRNPIEPTVSGKAVGEPVYVAGYLVLNITAHADEDHCVVVGFDHGGDATRVRLIPEAARLLAAHAASRADLN